MKLVLFGHVDDLRDPVTKVPVGVEYGRDGHVAPDHATLARDIALRQTQARPPPGDQVAEEVGPCRHVVRVGHVKESQGQQFGLAADHEFAHRRIDPYEPAVIGDQTRGHPREVERQTGFLFAGSHRLLRPPAFGDVTSRRKDAGDLTALVAVDGRVVENLGDGAVDVTDRQRVVGDCAFGEGSLVTGSCQVGGGEVRGEVTSDQGLSRDASGRLRGRVHVSDGAFGADRDQWVEARLDQAP